VLPVSLKVIRENGPAGSALTQMSDFPFRESATASVFSSGDRDMASMVPCGSQLGSTRVAPPSRVTETTRRAPMAPPVVYTSVPLGESARSTLNPPARTPTPSNSAIGGPVSSSLAASNGSAISFPSAVTTSRWPLGA
jgi:hypothetical protein